MDFEFTETQESLKRNVRDFLNREIFPLADEYERKYRGLPKEVLIKLLKILAPFGYVGGILPKEVGGHGLDFFSYGLLLEELAQIYPSLAIMELGQTVAVRYSMYKLGSERLKRKYLPALLSCELVGAIAITEPNVGSGLRELSTTAHFRNGEYVINGTKTWSTVGTIADIVYVTAAIAGNDEKRQYTILVADRKHCEFLSREIPKLGLRNVPSAEIVFQETRVPEENVLGEPGRGLELTLESIGLGRLGIATIAVGIAEAALERSIDYVRKRKQFGKPIGKFQLIQEMIAEMETKIECARLLVYKGWDFLDKGRGNAALFSKAKLFATEAAIDVTSKAIEIYGAYGLSEEYPLERLFRDARCLTFPDATSEIQKLIIGREIIGYQAFV